MDVETNIVDPSLKPDPVEDKAKARKLAPSTIEGLRELQDAMVGESKTQV